MSNIKQIINRLLSGSYIFADVVSVLEADAQETEVLYAAANRKRKATMGDEVHLRGLIELTNFCRNDCLYCGLRRSNTRLQRYRLTKEEIIHAALIARKYGYRTIVLQGGEDVFFTGKVMAEIITAIKQVADFAVTVSMGVMDPNDYELMRNAGADRYLMRHETADSALFSKLRPGTSLYERIECLHTLRSLGYEIGSGNMIGLPGQTIESIAEDIMLLVRLNIDMAGVGPFIPHPDTPLYRSKQGDVSLVLKELAILRLLIPGVNLPATTALATISPEWQIKALKAGANVIMPNITSEQHKKYYTIYPNKKGNFETSDVNHERVMRMLIAAGRYPAKSCGNRRKINNDEKDED